MRKILVFLMSGIILASMAGLSHAGLTVIGTANYIGVNYKLIYDNDDTGYGGGGLVWLDYSHPDTPWQELNNWVSMFVPSLSLTLNPGYITDIDWTTGWRLPDTLDGIVWELGYEGDPNNDGIYDYIRGFNLANSEMGHLFYTELGNKGLQNTDGTYNEMPPSPEFFLQNSGVFDNLRGEWYWTGTAFTAIPGQAWYFGMRNGIQNHSGKHMINMGLAVQSGNVTAVPIPAGIYLFASGFLFLAGFKSRKHLKQNRRTH